MKTRDVASALVALSLGGCIFGGGDDDLSSPSSTLIATCGAGISISDRKALDVSFNKGFKLSIGRRSQLRAAFLDGFPKSDMPSRVVAYTEYIACITNETEREFELSNILERKIRFISHMRTNGLGSNYVSNVSRLYDEQYEATQKGLWSVANQKLGGIAVEYFKAVQAEGIPIAVITPMPLPPLPPVTDSAFRPETQIEQAKRQLRALAEENTQPVSPLSEAATVCRNGAGFDACVDARNEVR